MRVVLKILTGFFLSRFMIWNTMMGTSILSIPWGIKQVNYEKCMHMKMLLVAWLTLHFFIVYS